VTAPVVVVGSGASGVHFARSAVDRGRRVLMLDVGHPAPEPVLPEAGLNGLKREHPDPAAYFLGEDFESVLLPGTPGEYYAFPPSKEFVFRQEGAFPHRSDGFEPLLSFAKGGLAEAWTGGCYPFTDDELFDFPFDQAEISRYYALIAKRIGITGTEDDLAPFFPVHDGLLEPLDLDEHSALLLERYGEVKSKLAQRFRAFLGRARLAVLSEERPGRKACTYLGRCLWGCPTKAFYTPRLTLAELREHELFEYRSGLRVDHFKTDADGNVRSVVARRMDSGPDEEIPVETLVLAAGTLATAKIYLESIRRDTSICVELPGLMDNRQVLMPFVNLRLLGRPFDPETYQYHQLAVALAADDPADSVHGLVTTLKTALVHPMALSFPGSLRTGLAVIRNAHAALGLLNINFTDRRRPESAVSIEPGANGESRLVVRYRPGPKDATRVEETCRRFRKILRTLGCVAPKPLAHVRPMGASVHYSGTLPMRESGGQHTVDADCRSRDFENLVIADGSTFPSLPAKNLTFTLMANAARIGERV